MALWFSRVGDRSRRSSPSSHCRGFAQAALTSGVQAGFVLGCLASASSGSPTASIRAACSPRPPRSAPPPTRCCWSSIPASRGAPLLRVVTGACMAGVYPVGMKLAVDVGQRAIWGSMVGILVGALTLGSASPHLFNALGGVNWRIPLAPRVR